MINKTAWKLYSTNEEVWNDMLNDCSKAEKSIDLEQFIFMADDFGKKLIDICAERASEGVRVRFLWDAAGSFTFWGSSIASELKQRGIELVFWRTLIPGYFKIPDFRSWFLRNHRRTLVIDNKVGYTGSICVRDSYKNWRDTNVRLQGKVVLEMSNAFIRMWHRALESKPIPPRILSDDKEFQYVTNFPAPGRRHIYSSILDAIKGAKKYIFITTPYFVPPGKLIRSLKYAANRGVDVRILIPDKSDYYAVDLGARSYFDTLLRSGASIYLYKGNMIHSKTIVIDDEWSTVGTMNLDRISIYYNYEANLVSINSDFAQELKNIFISDLNEANPVSFREWKSRFFVEKLPEIAIKLLRNIL